MQQVRYDGPGRRLAAFGKTLERGDSDEFTDEEFELLQAQPHIHITVLPGHPDQTADKRGGRRARNSAAAEAADADTSAPDGGEPEADPGEGHHDNPKNQED